MSTPEFTIPDSIAGAAPRIGIVLGSGLGGFADLLEDPTTVDYADIGGLPVSAVPGHAGTLHLGSLSGVPLVVARGRVHLYEGRTAREAASLVRLLHQLGVPTVLLTNAAGIVNESLRPGGWMLLSDHLNLVRQSPLAGSPNFVDQTEVYSRRLRERLLAGAEEIPSLSLAEGVYAWVNGPEYETPAEIRMLRTLGADAVGMSTVPEAIQARALGMEVAALSCLTNYGAGVTGEPLSHEEVMAVGESAARDLVSLLERTLPGLEFP